MLNLISTPIWAALPAAAARCWQLGDQSERIAPHHGRFDDDYHAAPMIFRTYIKLR
jgi:hypothetical protein